MCVLILKPNKKYQVEGHYLTCAVCKEICPYCHVCKWMYICFREDSDVRTKNVFKHIHAVVYFFRKIPIDQTKLSKEEIERIHEVVSAEVVSESYVKGYNKKR